MSPPSSAHPDQPPASDPRRPAPPTSATTGRPAAPRSGQPGRPRRAAGDPVLTAEREHLVRSRRVPRPTCGLGPCRSVTSASTPSPARHSARPGRAACAPWSTTRPSRPSSAASTAPRTREHPKGEIFHVGRRHVRDDAGDPLVIDWRAPMSRSFYRATPTDPMGVRRRRRFGFSAGALTSYEDEPLTPRCGESGGGRGEPDPARRDRAAPRRSDAGHRRHHPAGPGRPRPCRARGQHLRAGRPRHRQDRGGPAPCGLPALHLPRAAAPVGRAGRRPQPRLPRLHRRGAARARRDRGDPVHGRGAARAGPRPRHRPG